MCSRASVWNTFILNRFKILVCQCIDELYRLVVLTEEDWVHF